MAVTQEPILTRLDRLDNLMRHLENIRGSNNTRSPKCSPPSTPSSATTRNSDGHASSLDFFSPRTRDNLHCRPIDDVIVETEQKGTLLDRVALIEQRLLKLQQHLEAEKHHKDPEQKSPSSHKKSGLKQFVKSCVKGNKDKPNK